MNMQYAAGKSSPRIWFDRELRSIRDFAEVMAREMETRISEGANLDFSIVEASFRAVPGHQRHSGHSYARVISFLASYWKHGEALRQLHNHSELAMPSCSVKGVMDLSQISLIPRKID